MCFRVAIIRITEHFVFQGAAAGAELCSAVSGLGITLKSLKFIVKNSVLGSGGCKMERKWTLKMHFFGVLKSYEFIVKNGGLGRMSVIQKINNF